MSLRIQKKQVAKEVNEYVANSSNTEVLLTTSQKNIEIIYDEYLKNKLSKNKLSLYNLMLVLIPEIEGIGLKFTLQSEQQQLLF